MTLNTLLNKVIKPIIEDHLMINDFGFGELEKFALSKTQKYPLIWVTLKNVSYGAKAYKFSFAFVFADILKDDLSNNTELQSDMMQIAADVIARLVNIDSYDIEVLPGFSLQPFTERFTDLLSGVVADVEIFCPSTISDCEFPSATKVNSKYLLTEDSEAIKTEQEQKLTN